MGRHAWFVLIVVGVLSVGQPLRAIDIFVSGSWFVTIDATNLQNGPGSDLDPTHTSSNTQIRITIRNTNRSWIVYVRSVPANWHPDVRLGLRRTRDGLGPGWISGGTSWMELDEIDREFFRGSMRRSNVRARCGIDGVSVAVPPDTYSTIVMYTVMEL